MGKGASKTLTVMFASSLSGDSFEEKIVRSTREHYRHLRVCSDRVTERQRSRDESEPESSLLTPGGDGWSRKAAPGERKTEMVADDTAAPTARALSSNRQSATVAREGHTVLGQRSHLAPGGVKWVSTQTGTTLSGRRDGPSRTTRRGRPQLARVG